MPSRTRAPARRRLSPQATLSAAKHLLKSASATDRGTDPLVGLWQEWRRASSASKRLSRHAQRLERKLAERIGFPRVAVPDAGGTGSVGFASDPAQIDRLVGKTAAMRTVRRRLKSELADARARWEAEADASGLTRAVQQEEAADRHLDALLKAAASTPARTLVGAVAKLAIVAEWSAVEPEVDGYPWIFLHGVLADLTAMAAGTEPVD